MKKIILTAFVCSIIFACSKDDSNEPQNLPKSAFVHFELLKLDGTSFNQGDIEYKTGGYDSQGHLVFSSEWMVLPKIEESYFGNIEFQLGPGYSPITEGTEWIYKKYVLLKYYDTEVIDTIIIRDSARYPEYRYYDIFLNNEIIQSYTQEEDGGLSWLISLTKDEF
jgi:hypothetical protein